MTRYSDLVLADSPSLFWALDATTGGTDLSGNGRTGTANGGITIGGFSGAPLVDATTSTDFNEASSQTVRSTYAPGGADKTLFGWAYRDASSNADAIWGTGSGGSPFMRLASGSQDVVFFPASSASTTWSAAWPGNGQWVFWALVFTDSANTASLYINGALVSTQAQADAWGAGDLRIGARSGTSEPFDGKQYGFAVFERALAAGTIKAYYEAGVNTFTERIVVRSKPPLRLSVDAVSPSGLHRRWGPDEPDAANVPSDLSFSTTMPGGFESSGMTLPRKPGVEYADLKRLSTLRVLGPGGQVAWEGRLEGAPRVSGSQMAVSPDAVGWQAHLEDDKSAAPLYVDRDLNNWGAMSRARKLFFIATPVSPVDGSVSPDPTTGIPAVVLAVDGNASTTRQGAEVLYDAGPGAYIDSIYYDVVRGTNATSSYTTSVFTDDTDLFSSATSTTTLAAAASATDTHTAGSNERYAALQMLTPSGDGGTDGLVHDMTIRRLTVWGSTGLTKRGTAPDDGLYASDVIQHALANWAPLIAYSSDTITDSSFVIPHLVFTDRTTAAEIISTANRYHLRDWAVWEDPNGRIRPTFYYHDRGARGKAWRARIGPSQLSEAGPQVARLWNGVLVRYSDVDGTTKTVGPTGSGADTISTSLVDADPLNPANELGIRRWDLLDMGGVSTPAGATEVGRRFLEESKLLDTSGQAQIVGHIEDDRGVLYPAWRIRAGDTVSFVDASSTAPRRVVKTSYSDATKTNSIDLDSPPDGLDALLERLQVVLVPLGL